MFEWLKFIGEFILEKITSIGDLFNIAIDSVQMFQSSFLLAPEFIRPILFCMFSIVIIMWVVNIF